MLENGLASLFKRRYSLLTPNGRKRIKERIERVAALEVVDERAKRDSGAHEDRRSAHDVRIDMHY